MLYVLICTDKKNSEDLRKEVRPEHLNYLNKFEIKLAGPMLDDDQTTMVGSIIFIECQSKDDAKAFVAKVLMVGRLSSRIFRFFCICVSN